mmetsp:Transcript_5675/g.16439  ORF Transcript_5675/g.16439 Transcript_5675/m.16439 type:complete len:228 (+) Transcript_5675:141-824(+)
MGGSKSDCLEKGISSNPVVVDHTTDGQHSQTSVLDFLQLHFSHLFLALSLRQAHGVESKVSGNSVRVVEHGLHGHISLVRPEFKNTHPENNLEHGRDSDDRRSHVGVINMLVSRDGPELLHDESKGSKHGRPSVLDFGLTKPLHVEVLREIKGVETDITDVSLQVLGVGAEGKRLGHLSVELSGNSIALGSRSESGGRSQQRKSGESLHGDVAKPTEQSKTELSSTS